MPIRSAPWFSSTIRRSIGVSGRNSSTPMPASPNAGAENEMYFDMWRLMDAMGVDVQLNGHNHIYHRWAAQTADGIRDANGIRQFTIGTGGRSLYPLGKKPPSGKCARRPEQVLRSPRDDAASRRVRLPVGRAPHGPRFPGCRDGCLPLSRRPRPAQGFQSTACSSR